MASPQSGFSANLFLSRTRTHTLAHMHGKLFMQLSWLPSRSRHRSWVNDCICRRQQLEVTQKQNMLLIPATCNGQICRRRIKYACEAGAKSKESPLDPEQHKVRRRDDFHEKKQKKAACYKFCDSIRNTNTTGHGRMRKRHLVMDFLPVRWMRLTFCGQPAAAPIGNSHSASTHTHTSFTLIFQFQRIPDRRTNWQAVRLDRQTDGQTYRITFSWARSSCCWLFCNDFITQPETSNATDCSASKGCFMKCAAQPDISIFIQFRLLEIPLRLKGTVYVFRELIQFPLRSRVYWLIRRNADYTMRTMFRIIFHFINFPASCTCARPFCLRSACLCCVYAA